MKKLYMILALVAVCVLVTAGYRLWRSWADSPAPERVSYAPAKISEVREMVDLQTVSVYEEVPFKAHVGSRHLVGRVTVEGTIGFDLEKVTLSERGDTLVVTLPAANVTLRESTAPDSYVVYDSWNDQVLGVSEFSAAQENAAKGQVLSRVTRNLEGRGEARRAREAAKVTVARLLSTATGRPVECR